MSDLRTLRYLIDAAVRERDEAAQRVARTQGDVQAADRTRRMLHDYRSELAMRSPVLRRDSFDPSSLRHFGAFNKRLDTAITEQGQQVTRFERIADNAQRELVERQRRLHSLEALVKRREAMTAIAEQRREQKRSDEFAARAYAARTGALRNGGNHE